MLVARFRDRALVAGLALGPIALAACADLERADENAAPVGGSASGGSGVVEQGGSAGSVAPGSGGVAGSGGMQDLGGSSATEAGTSAGGSSAAGAGGEGEETCPTAPMGALRASVHAELADAMNSELHPFVLVTNSGPPLTLTRLKVRYYFSAEHRGAWETACYWVSNVDGASSDATGLCKLAQLQVRDAVPPTSQADSYLEWSFPDSGQASLGGESSLELRGGFWLQSRASLTQTNDYSFLPSSQTVTEVSGFPYRETTHVTLYVDDALVWGTEPCAP